MHFYVCIECTQCICIKFSKYWSVKYFNWFSFRQLFGQQRLLSSPSRNFPSFVCVCVFCKCVFSLKYMMVCVCVFPICQCRVHFYSWSIKWPDAPLQFRKFCENGDSVNTITPKWIRTGIWHAFALRLLTCIWHGIPIQKNEGLLKNNFTWKIPFWPLHFEHLFAFSCIEWTR